MENKTPFEDITVQKQTAERPNLHEFITNTIPAKMAFLSRDYIYLAVNDMYAEYFNMPKGQIIGKNVRELLGEEVFQNQVKCYLDRALKGERVTYDIELEFPRKRRLCMRMTYSPYRSGGGNIEGIVSLGIDITEQKKDEEIIRGLLREKELLLREVHHRVKNNMNLILSMLCLEEQTHENPEVVSVLQELGGRIRTTLDMNELLFHGAGFQTVDLTSYLQVLIDHMQQIRYYTDRVRLELDAEPVIVDARLAYSVGLIVNELVTNSLKYAFPDNRAGKVSVRVVSEEIGFLELHVQDDGIGLPEGFDITKAESFGSNLVSILTAQHEGSIEVSTGTGKGTLFEFRFPFHPAPLPPRPDFSSTILP
jgi:PAS domain S-box-containing protein